MINLAEQKSSVRYGQKFLTMGQVTQIARLRYVSGLTISDIQKKIWGQSGGLRQRAVQDVLSVYNSPLFAHLPDTLKESVQDDNSD